MIENGTPEELGAHIRAGGANFAVYSPDASKVEVCLFNESALETARVDLPAHTDGIWHGFFPGLGAGQVYGFRAHGRYEPSSGLRFNPNKLLLDPYARELSGELYWSDAVFDFDPASSGDRLLPSQLDSAPCVPKSVIAQPIVSAATRVSIPWTDTLIYELNVRGFTMRHPAIDESSRGRVGALSTAPLLDHFKALGITSVELLPIHAFVDERFLVQKGLRNFWGYNSLGFFAPDTRYLGSDGLAGLKKAIDALHDANIEVLLDVVYNHTAEGGNLGPSLSFRGLANADYYRLRPDLPAEYVNDTGCGNTVNTDHSIVRRLIIDSLRYWVTVFGIDGFRFDLATVLGRTPAGFSREHQLFDDLRRVPELKDVKLIAEPWDIGPGGYQLGAFPAGWAEWNDQYRDTVRRFWRGESGIAPGIARRLHGSSDIFEASGRGPAASVNFVTSHDGFTAADLVSFVDRHNLANGEENRDGHAHNFSVNHGVEGATDDPEILQLRRRHRLNLLATLLFSQGTPMLLAGDDFGNSQSGNNNAYAQDNDTGWVDWQGLKRDPEFFDEVCSLVRLRRDLLLLRQEVYRHGDEAKSTGRADIEWFNPEGHAMTEADWHKIASLGMLLSQPNDNDHAKCGLLAVAVILNADAGERDFSLPVIGSPGAWTVRYCSAGGSGVLEGAGVFRSAGFSIACLTYDEI